MRRFYSIALGFMLAVLVPVVAKAYSVTVNVDDTARVQLVRYGSPIEGVVPGDNVIEYDGELNMTIQAVDGAIIEKIKSSYDYDQTQTWVSSYNLSGGSRINGRTYTVTSKMVSEVRTASFTLNVDDAAKAYCMLSGSSYIVPLTNGANTVAFIPEVENWLTIGANTTAPLVSVLHNGNVVSPQWGSYSVNVANGDTVDIQTVASVDAVAKLNIVYSEGGEGCITAVKLNDVEAEMANPMVGKPGDKLTFTFDRSAYTVSTVQLDNEPPVTLRADNYSVYLKEGESTFTVTATKNSAANVTLRLVDPSHVTVYRGSRYDFDEITGLVAGDNVIEFTGANPKMDITANTDVTLKSVTVNGTEKMVDGDLWAFRVADGDVVVVDTEKAATEPEQPTYAYSIKLNVDDPSRLSVRWVKDDVAGDPIALVAGDNTLGFNEMGEFKLTAAEGALIANVKNVNDGYNVASYCANYNIWCSEYADGSVFEVTTAIESELRTGSFTLVVDNPEAVSISRGGTYTTVEGLVAGENTVLFMPEEENSLQVRAAQYGTPLYSVQLNGEEQTESYGSYSFNIAQGDTVKVVSAFPEGDATYAISYTNGDNGCVSKITVNGNEIEKTDTIAAKLGDKVEVFFNEVDYVINSLVFNGGEPQTSSWGFYSYSTVLKQAENTLVIDASKNVEFNVTLKLTDPAHLNVFRGSEWDYDMFEDLVAGENTLTFKSDNTTLTLVGKDGNQIQSVTANGEAVAVAENRAEVTVAENMVVEVVSAPAQRDNTMVVYVDNIAGAEYGHSCTRSDRSTFELVDGYNTVKYADTELPILFAFYLSEGAPAAYNNDQTFAPKYEGGSTYELTEAVNNGTVLKFFFNGAPSTCTVNFNISEGVEASVVRDLILPVTPDAAAPVSVLAGTRFDMTVPAQDGLEVKVNDAVLEAVDNVYSFTVTANTAVDVNIKNGVENVSVSNAADNAVYNLQGVRVGTADRLKTLPAGIYVVAGKKVVVK